MNLIDHLKATAGLDSAALGVLFALFGLATLFFFIVTPALFFVTHLERKLTADLQARVGPNRAGWAGLSQSLADLLKLLQKQGSQRPLILSWSTVETIALFSSLAVLPLGSAFLFLDPDMGAFLPVFSLCVFSLASVLQSLKSGEIRGNVGAIRGAAQFITGIVPAVLALGAVGVRAGGFRWSVIVSSQASHAMDWSIWTDPFQFLAFLVFVSSGLVILGVPPLHSAYSEVELNGGLSSSEFGHRLGVFRLSRMFAIFFWALISTSLFLGGWAGFTSFDAPFAAALEVLWVLVKALFLLFGVLLIARTIPRVRSDQVTDFTWRVITPMALLSLVGTAFWTLGKEWMK